MYTLLENNSNFSDTTGSAWCYSKDEGTNFYADIVKTNTFEFFE